jgi:putative hydrolase of the HAD superfamily
MAIRAVLFDATGTLIELRDEVGATYSRVAASYGVSLPARRLTDAFTRVLRHAPPRVFADETPDAAADLERAWWRERVRQTFRAADSTVRFADFDGFFDTLYEAFASAETWQLRRGAAQVLAALHDDGLALGVVSNFDHRLPRILDQLGIGAQLRVVALPHLHGAAKPDAALYRAALTRLDVTADECVYVGDDPENDGVGAKNAGLHFLDARAPAALEVLPARIAEIATLGD